MILHFFSFMIYFVSYNFKLNHILAFILMVMNTSIYSLFKIRNSRRPTSTHGRGLTTQQACRLG